MQTWIPCFNLLRWQKSTDPVAALGGEAVHGGVEGAEEVGVESLAVEGHGGVDVPDGAPDSGCGVGSGPGELSLAHGELILGGPGLAALAPHEAAVEEGEAAGRALALPADARVDALGVPICSDKAEQG